MEALEQTAALAAFATAGAGLLAGGHHALTGPDHLAGVAPFAVDARERAWRVGAAWGAGHALGALAAAALALVLRARIPGIEEQLSALSERLVGVVLCVVGAIGLRAALRARGEHAHPHAHAGDASLVGRSPARSAFGIGLVHGAAGLAHLFAVVPALALPGVALPALYLGGYALGSLGALTLVASLLGRSSARFGSPRRWVGAASVVSLAVGVFWLVAGG